MPILVIDTSGSRQAVLLLDGNAVIARAGWSAGELSAVAAARGPGSFTGIRLGLGLALGIASGRGVPLFLLDSLRVLAAQALRDGSPAGALRDAGRGEVYAWRPTLAPARIATTSLPGWIQADDRLVVDPPGALAEWSAGQAAWEVPGGRRRSLLEALAGEANRVTSREKPVRYHEVEAMYVQPAAAEERRSR